MALVRRRVIRRAAGGVALHLPWASVGRQPAGRIVLRSTLAGSQFPEWEPRRARRMLEAWEFRFLCLSFQARTSIPWSGGPVDSMNRGRGFPGLPKLWFYHLNYCDFLNLDLSRPDDSSLLASAFDIALDWIRANHRGKQIAWDPYPLSLRVVNWLKFTGRNAQAAQALGRGADIRKMVDSISDQVSWLAGQVEEDLGGNHLMKNAKALLFAGALLDCAESERWWKQGSELLARELEEQVLADGGHVERSPMYHCQVLEDLLDVEAIASAAPQALAGVSELRAAIARMASFLRTILHPDGAIPLLNDSSFGMATPACELLRRARALEPEQHEQNRAWLDGSSAVADSKPSATATVLADTGYGVLRDRATSSFAILDCGPLGPNYQPGHGHCDLLSYELSLHGQRIVVDTGVSTYEPGARRLYERSSPAHNTLCIDGHEQAEIWSSFRVGRRPQPGRLECGVAESPLGQLHWVQGWHCAGAHGNIVHTRAIACAPGGMWLIVDTLEGAGQARLESFLHFHPRVRVEPSTGGRAEDFTAFVLEFAGLRYFLFTSGEGHLDLGTTAYAPEFGRREPRFTIVWTCQSELPAQLVYGFAPAAQARDSRETFCRDEVLRALSLHGALGTRTP